MKKIGYIILGISLVGIMGMSSANNTNNRDFSLQTGQGNSIDLHENADKVSDIVKDAAGNVYVSTHDKGIFEYNKEDKKLTNLKLPSGETNVNDMSYSKYLDKIAIATDNTIMLWNCKTKSVETSSNLENNIKKDKNTINANIISMNDNGDIVWVNYYDSPMFYTNVSSFEKDGQYAVGNPVINNHSGTIWKISISENKLFYIDDDGNSHLGYINISFLKSNLKISNLSVSSWNLAVNGSGNTAVGNYLSNETPQSLFVNGNMLYFIDSNGNVKIFNDEKSSISVNSSNLQTVAVLNGKEVDSSDISVDNDGNIWVGYYNSSENGSYLCVVWNNNEDATKWSMSTFKLSSADEFNKGLSDISRVSVIGGTVDNDSNTNDYVIAVLNFTKQPSSNSDTYDAKITFTTVHQSAANSLLASSKPSSTPSSKTGMIVGITVGSTAAIILVVGIAIFIKKRKQI